MPDPQYISLKEFEPPSNLPTEELLWQERYNTWKKNLDGAVAKFASTFVLTALILLSAVFVGKENIRTGQLQFQDLAVNVQQELQQKLADRALVLGARVNNNFPFLGPVGDVAWRYADWLTSNTLTFSRDVDAWYSSTNDNFNHAIANDLRTYVKAPQNLARATLSATRTISSFADLVVNFFTNRGQQSF